MMLLGWILDSLPSGKRPNHDNVRLWSIVACMETTGLCAECVVNNRNGCGKEGCIHEKNPIVEPLSVSRAQGPGMEAFQYVDGSEWSEV